MTRHSTVRRAIAVGAMALTAALAVPAAAGTGTDGSAEANRTGLESQQTRTAAQASAAGQAITDHAATNQALATQAAVTRTAVDRTAGAATALAGIPGYAGVAVDYEAATVTVSWKGEVPAQVSRLLAQSADDVTVDVRPTALSEAELRAASTRLLNSQRALYGPDAVLTAIPTSDYAGLVAEVSRESAAAGLPDLAQRLERAAGVPVRPMLVDRQVESTSGTRADDQAPWNAGGAIATKDGTDYCSTGFSIVIPEGRRIVSAAHCNERVGDVVRDGEGQLLGTVTHRAAHLDAQLIDPVGDTQPSGTVYGGPWDARPDHENYQFPVTTVGRPAVGQQICSSGAVSGEHCATVRATDMAWTCGEATCHGFRASRDDGGVVVGAGDSGGPMFVVIDGKAHARGMIDGGSSRRSCGRTSLPTQCFSYVYGIPLVDILNHWNARLDR